MTDNRIQELEAALLDARADAEAAVALAVEEAEDAILPKDDPGVWRGSWFEPALREAQARIRALAPADGLALVQALRGEVRESAMQALASMGQAQEAYEAQLKAEAELAAAQQREAEAYALGFEASAEGWNGEYPTMDFRSDPDWLADRDRELAALSHNGGGE